MEKIIAFSNRTEARDKFTKAIQYSSKLIAWALLYNNRIYHKRFNDLYILTRDSRKVFKLFKTIQETKNILDKLKDLLWKKDKIPVVLEIFSRLGFMIYWVFDNLVILNRLKLIQSDDVNFYSYLSHYGWLIGIIWSLLKNVYELICILKDKNYKREDRFGNETKFDRKEEIVNHFISIVGNLGDMLPASSGVYLSEKLFGFQLSDGLIGLGGFVSAFIQIRELWNIC
jgi:peroxin-11B